MISSYSRLISIFSIFISFSLFLFDLYYFLLFVVFFNFIICAFFKVPGRFRAGSGGFRLVPGGSGGFRGVPGRFRHLHTPISSKPSLISVSGIRSRFFGKRN